EASHESRLGIGIGIGLDFVVLTTEKLPTDRPYLADVLNRSDSSDRRAGSNAARLVKRMPLSDMNAE
ncbi:MAG TPA: glycerol dehydratase reactivase beta/small subunit family protein, partial [Propionibacteriaceae bacterium]|nr:glycerol dehydratase reactivase beta/small subunit family protein [Propionibacteriaceae bacterium]